MKRLSYFTLRISLTWLCVYLWLGSAADGAFNLLSFYLWAILPLSLLVMFASIKPSEKMLKVKPMPRILAVLDNLSDLALTLLLAWCGHFGLAIALLLTLLFSEVTRMHMREARTKAAAAA
jgi:hypothetical protein